MSKLEDHDPTSTSGSDKILQPAEFAFREEIVRQIFGDVGTIEDDFSCAVESKILLHGRMYVTNKFICFYSNLFGLEKKIRIPYSHITCISKENTALVIPNAIAVITHRKEYIFRSFWDREECYVLLTRFQEASRAAGHPEAEEDKGMRKRSSTGDQQPSPSERRVVSEGNVLSLLAQDKQSPKQQQQQQAHSVTPNTVTPLAGATKAPSIDETASEGSADDHGSNSHRHSAAASAVRASKKLSAEMDELDTDLGMHDTEEDDEQGFKREVEKSLLKIPVYELKFPVGLRKLQALLVDDDAPFSFAKYHSDNGDSDVTVTEWKEGTEGIGFARELRFIKPLSFSIGPSKTRGIKLQLLKRFGAHGFVLFTSTRLEDIPNGDCFCVDDVSIVRSIGENECHMEIRLELKFFKSTMWKRIIETTTVTETSKWLSDYANACRDFCLSGAGADAPARKPKISLSPSTDDNPAAPDVTTANPINTTTWVRSVLIFLVITMCLFGGWRWRSSAQSSMVANSPKAGVGADAGTAPHFWKDRLDRLEQDMQRNQELIAAQQALLAHYKQTLDALQNPENSPKAEP